MENGTPYFIEFIDVYKSFDDRKVLDGVSFGVRKGETFAILGPSGVGKTVLLTHVVGLNKPDRGKIIVAGVDITNLGEDELAKIRRKVQRAVKVGPGIGRFESQQLNRAQAKLPEFGHVALRQLGNRVAIAVH